MQDEYTGGFARGSPMAALAQNYVVLDIGAFTLLLASCFRFTPVSLFYFVAFFATQSMTPKDVSSWFVLLGMLAVVSFAACAFHTAWVISLLVGFALPKEALFIFHHHRNLKIRDHYYLIVIHPLTLRPIQLTHNPP